MATLGEMTPEQLAAWFGRTQEPDRTTVTEEIDRVIDGNSTDGEATGAATLTVTRVTTDSDRGLNRRVPFVFTCDEWIRTGRNSIVMWVNPQEASFTIPIRESEEPTSDGFVINEFVGPDGTTMGVPRVSFTCSTGNTIPKGGAGPVAPANLQRGLVNLYEFGELRTNRGLTGDNRPNMVYCYFNSRVYPSMLIIGRFAGSDFAVPNNAENPNEVSYSLEMVIARTQPALNNAADLISAWRSAGAPGADPMQSVTPEPAPPAPAPDPAPAETVQTDTAASTRGTPTAPPPVSSALPGKPTPGSFKSKF